MSFTIKYRTQSVEIILDQDAAEEINQLGVKLARENAKPRISEAGNPMVKELAQQIEDKSEAVKADTLTLELKALSFSQWKDVLARNTVRSGEDKGMRDMLGIAKQSLPLMLVTATQGGRKVPKADLSEESLGGLLEELTDGQFTPLWEAIISLNGSRADPKAARELASTILN